MNEVLDVCCGGRMFYFQKNAENMIYGDMHIRPKGCIEQQKNFTVMPDVVFDFRNLPFQDDVFNLVVFDPPHVSNLSLNSITGKKYGSLNKETWKEDLKTGFDECYRVLKKGGTLIFKWNEVQVTIREVLDLFEIKPLFGHTTAKSGKTKWMCFYKEMWQAEG